MQQLNYQHLYYFWIVCNEGTISAAAERLRLAQPTVSAQLKTFEGILGHQLFERSGRKLKLTEKGVLVKSYAEEIFSLGGELVSSLQGNTLPGATRLRVGIADVLPKLVVFALLKPAFNLQPPVRIEAFDGKNEELLSKLSLHGLDLVIADTPVGAGVKVKAFNHLLGESTISFYAEPKIVTRHKKNFPQSLNGAPMLLPIKGTTIRRTIDHWLENNDINPIITGEYEDSSLLKIMGQAGLGIFPLPKVIEGIALKQFKIKLLGDAPDLKERFYAISLERKIQHLGIKAITESARADLF